jgi:hypothetical protein
MQLLLSAKQESFGEKHPPQGRRGNAAERLIGSLYNQQEEMPNRNRSSPAYPA